MVLAEMELPSRLKAVCSFRASVKVRPSVDSTTSDFLFIDRTIPCASSGGSADCWDADLCR
jgi:hypothetical protein